LVEANPFSGKYYSGPVLEILTPYPSKERCYSNASVEIKIGVLLENSSSSVYPSKVSYSLDNGEKIALTNVISEHWAKAGSIQPTVPFTANITLYNLTEGNHTLCAYLIDSKGKELVKEIIFTIDSSYRDPELTLISPQKINYTTNQVQLIFSTNKEFRMLDIFSIIT
jgi:hypothetical protein